MKNVKNMVVMLVMTLLSISNSIIVLVYTNTFNVDETSVSTFATVNLVLTCILALLYFNAIPKYIIDSCKKTVNMIVNDDFDNEKYWEDVFDPDNIRLKRTYNTELSLETIVKTKLTNEGMFRYFNYYFNNGITPPELNNVLDKNGYYTFKMSDFVTIFATDVTEDEFDKFVIRDKIKYINY